MLAFSAKYDKMEIENNFERLVTMDDLTPKQREIYEFIKKEERSKGVPPTIREMGKAVGLSSTSSIHLHLNNLEAKKYIARPKSKNRCIEILEDDFYTSGNDNTEYCNIPIVGTVAAGEPILATENIDGYFPVPSEYLSGGDNFMLKIKGNSMANAGIFNGDLVLVKQQNTAENNDIVIAMIDDSATCKRYFKEEEYIRLQPENDSYEPIYVKECTILGLVKGLFRSFK